MKKGLLSIIMIYCFCFADDAFCRKGVSFSFQEMPQTQLVFEWNTYRIRPGIGAFYNKNTQEGYLIIDNDFIFRRINKLNPFLGIGIKGILVRETIYSYNKSIRKVLSIEPNFGLQYNFNDNFSVFGNVRLSASYSGYDGAVFSFGKTAIGLVFYK